MKCLLPNLKIDVALLFTYYDTPLVFPDVLYACNQVPKIA